jgi:uncharacterized protein (TIGR02246 family)
MLGNPFDRYSAESQSPESAVQHWLNTLCQHNPKDIVALYHPQATLLGTLADNIKVGTSAIRRYFDFFVLKKPCGVITSMKVNRYGDLAVANGTYDFTLHEEGKETKVSARFTYVLKLVNGKWLIETHHSSLQP